MYKGLDVSHHQHPDLVPWDKVDFGYIRATYGVKPDKYFAAHRDRAKKAGVPVGAYHFFRKQKSVGAQQAAFQDHVNGHNLELVNALDIESNGTYDGSDLQQSDATALEKMRDGFGILYVNVADWIELDCPRWGVNHKLWLARWTVTGRTGRHYDDAQKIPSTHHNRNFVPEPWSDFTLWQNGAFLNRCDFNWAKSIPFKVTKPNTKQLAHAALDVMLDQVNELRGLIGIE